MIVHWIDDQPDGHSSQSPHTPPRRILRTRRCQIQRLRRGAGAVRGSPITETPVSTVTLKEKRLGHHRLSSLAPPEPEDIFSSASMSFPFERDHNQLYRCNVRFGRVC